MEHNMDIKELKKRGERLLKKRGLEDAAESESWKQLLSLIGSVSKDTPQQHFRVMSEEERKYLMPEAFGYLSHLFYMGSISTQLFEQIIAFALHIHFFTNKKISKSLMDTIVNYHIFSGQQTVSVRDFISIITESETDQNWNEAN